MEALRQLLENSIFTDIIYQHSPRSVQSVADNGREKIYTFEFSDGQTLNFSLRNENNTVIVKTIEPLILDSKIVERFSQIVEGVTNNSNVILQHLI